MRKNLLNNDDVFLFDTGAELFVWVGKGASQQEKARCAFNHTRNRTRTRTLANLCGWM